MWYGMNGKMKLLHNNDFPSRGKVKWVDYKSDSSMTCAGLEIIDGKLDMRGMKERQVPRA
jgi:hypothetical protein